MPLPPPRGWPRHLFTLFFFSLSLLALYSMRLSPAASSVSLPFETAVRTLRFPRPDFPLRESYTGIPAFDLGLRFLVTAFLPGVAGWDPEFRVQQIYFLVSFFSVIAIWSVEAGRERSKGRVTSFTSIWALLYQTVGGAVIIPLYYLALMHESADKDYYSPAARHIPIHYAKALLPSLLIGYLLPTLAMYLPLGDPDLYRTQGLVALWQFSPWIVNLLIFLISNVYKKLGSSPPQAKTTTTDMKSLYLMIIFVCTIFHLTTLYTCLTDPSISLHHTLLLLPSPERLSLIGGLRYIFQADFWLIFAAALVGDILTMWDMKRMGREKVAWWRVLLRTGVVSVLVGPGTVLASWAYRREEDGKEGQKEKEG